MKIESIGNHIHFGLKFTDKAEELYQKSQNYIADIAIATHNDDDVINNNFNRDLIENSLSDEFVLDALADKTTATSEESYTFIIRHKNSKKGMYRSILSSKLENILNGKVWNKIEKKLNSFYEKSPQ